MKRYCFEITRGNNKWLYITSLIFNNLGGYLYRHHNLTF
ncbi:hypothetical protein HORM4_240063 [Vibrio harveyi]|nr:hypothetical protein HORM4_240063 [Vibrio harveyi]